MLSSAPRSRRAAPNLCDSRGRRAGVASACEAAASYARPQAGERHGTSLCSQQPQQRSARPAGAPPRRWESWLPWGAAGIPWDTSWEKRRHNPTCNNNSPSCRGRCSAIPRRGKGAPPSGGQVRRAPPGAARHHPLWACAGSQGSGTSGRSAEAAQSHPTPTKWSRSPRTRLALVPAPPRPKAATTTSRVSHSIHTGSRLAEPSRGPCVGGRLPRCAQGGHCGSASRTWLGATMPRGAPRLRGCRTPRAVGAATAVAGGAPRCPKRAARARGGARRGLAAQDKACAPQRRKPAPQQKPCEPSEPKSCTRSQRRCRTWRWPWHQVQRMRTSSASCAPCERGLRSKRATWNAQPRIR